MTTDSPIEIGDAVPRRGHPAVRRLVLAAMRAAGWRFEGSFPNLPKMVVLGAPHTSNWDFIVGLGIVFGLGLDFHWLGKHTLFRPPFDSVFKWAGGIPVNRRLPRGILDHATKQFEDSPAFILALSPEGTRSPVSAWKPGFHRIAAEADVPILLVSVDYAEKRIRFHEPIHPSGDFNRDVSKLMGRLESVTPKHPEGFSRNSPEAV